MNMNITFIGGGNMANALIGGLLKQGFPSAGITVVEPLAENRQRLSSAFNVTCLPAVGTPSLGEGGGGRVLSPAMPGCDVLALSVKPQQMQEALAPLAGKLSGQLVISIAAGVRVDTISRWLGGHSKIVRAMPNTPALIGAGMTGLYADPSVDAAGRRQAEQVLGAAGKIVWVDDDTYEEEPVEEPVVRENPRMVPVKTVTPPPPPVSVVRSPPLPPVADTVPSMISIFPSFRSVPAPPVPYIPLELP